MDLPALFHKYKTDLCKLNKNFYLNDNSFVYTTTEDNRLYGKVAIYDYEYKGNEAFDTNFFNSVLFIYPDNIINQFSAIYDLTQDFLITLRKFLFDLQKQISKVLNYVYAVTLEYHFIANRVKILLKPINRGNIVNVSIIHNTQSIFDYNVYHTDMENHLKILPVVLSKLSEVIKED